MKNISIVEIDSLETLPLRSKILRDNQPLESCHFPFDSHRDSIHLGALYNEKIVGIISLFSIDEMDNISTYKKRIRGLAIDHDFQNRGLGSLLLSNALERINKIENSYFWCNARIKACSFYENHGFRRSSEEFLIEGIGPHVQMALNCRKNL